MCEYEIASDTMNVKVSFKGFFSVKETYYKCVVSETAMFLENLWYDLCKALC